MSTWSILQIPFQLFPSSRQEDGFSSPFCKVIKHCTCKTLHSGKQIMQNTLSGISYKWIQLAGSGDSAPRIYFLWEAAWPACSILGKGVQHRALLHHSPQGPPLGRAGWWHTWHRDRLVWRRLEHRTEQLWRPSTSASPGVPYFNPYVGFSERFCCCWQGCSTHAPCWDESIWMDLHSLCFQAAPGML